MAAKCPAITKSGRACQGLVSPGRVYCISHDPERREEVRANGRKGGEAKATARRLAKQWAAIGQEVSDTDLNTILKSCMFAVKDGSMTPSQANAIAALARTAVTVRYEVSLSEQFAALEEKVNQYTDNTRKIG